MPDRLNFLYRLAPSIRSGIAGLLAGIGFNFREFLRQKSHIVWLLALLIGWRMVRQLAERIMAESGVRHGQLNQVSLTEDDHEHQHVGHDHSSRHRHLRPLS